MLNVEVIYRKFPPEIFIVSTFSNKLNLYLTLTFSARYHIVSAGRTNLLTVKLKSEFISCEKQIRVRCSPLLVNSNQTPIKNDPAWTQIFKEFILKM